MIDEAGAAGAAAEPLTLSQDSGGAAAVPDNNGDRAGAEPVIGRSQESARASVDRAFAELDKREAEEGGAKTAYGQARDEHGRFKPRDPQPTDPPTPEQQEADRAIADKVAYEKAAASIGEPPARLSADAKAGWATVPDAVKGEVHRAFRELESGLTQYQQFFEPLKPFYQLAQKHDTTVHDTLGRYISLDLQLVSEDPAERFSAIQEVLEYAGVSPQEYAAFITGQKPDQPQAQAAAEIRQLKAELAQMRYLLGGVHSTLEQSRESQIEAAIDEFARTHPRLNDAEFITTVSRLINTQMADGLESAYGMAERLIPAPAADTQQYAASSAATTQKPSDQTRKGQLSVAGAPVSGSNPVKRKPASSARESLDRAFAEVGLG